MAVAELSPIEQTVANYVWVKLYRAGYPSELAKEVAEARIDSELAIKALHCCKERPNASLAAMYLLGLRDEL